MSSAHRRQITSETCTLAGMLSSFFGSVLAIVSNKPRAHGAAQHSPKRDLGRRARARWMRAKSAWNQKTPGGWRRGFRSPKQLGTASSRGLAWSYLQIEWNGVSACSTLIVDNWPVRDLRRPIICGNVTCVC